MLDINELRNELPKIGDVLIKIPVTSSFTPEKKSHPCVVTYVNTEHLWYQAEFNFAGVKFKQNYNLLRGKIRAADAADGRDGARHQAGPDRHRHHRRPRRGQGV